VDQDDALFLHRLESGQLDAAQFDHTQHLRAAYLMLERDDFVTALYRLSNAIRQLAANAGASDKFNVTTTVAFMSLVAQSMYRTSTTNFESFLKQHPALTSATALKPWYTPDELETEAARQSFALPAPR
jgi:hypothetical protein